MRSKLVFIILLAALNLSSYPLFAQPPSPEVVEQMNTRGKNHTTVVEILDRVTAELESGSAGFASGYIFSILNANDWKDTPEFCIPNSSMRDIINRIVIGLYQLEQSGRGSFSAALSIPTILSEAYPC